MFEIGSLLFFVCLSGPVFKHLRGYLVHPLPTVKFSCVYLFVEFGDSSNNFDEICYV